jgi:structure-specific recognition protein 1
LIVVLIQVPRGRYEIEIHPTLLKMRGTTSSFNILHKTITHLFLLQPPNGRKAFVMNIDPPLRQNTSTYEFLLIEFPADEEVELELNMSEEDLAKFEGQLQKTQKGLTADIFAGLVKRIAGKKVFVSGAFTNSKGTKDIRCSLKADSGYLFPLDKSFVYINKPITYIRHEQIKQVVFHRVNPKGKEYALPRLRCVECCAFYLPVGLSLSLPLPLPLSFFFRTCTLALARPSTG